MWSFTPIVPYIFHEELLKQIKSSHYNILLLYINKGEPFFNHKIHEGENPSSEYPRTN